MRGNYVVSFRLYTLRKRERVEYTIEKVRERKTYYEFGKRRKKRDNKTSQDHFQDCNKVFLDIIGVTIDVINTCIIVIICLFDL